jgi:hypothetical protein
MQFPLASLLLLGLAPAQALSQVTMVDVIDDVGISNTSFGRGAATVDFDGDGLIDIAVANAGGPNLFWRQRQDHTFESANAAWGIAVDTWSSWAVVATDLDSDGDTDVFFGSGGFAYSQPNQVLRNDIATTGGLSDVSASAGDANISSQIFGATGLDYDLDGDVDVFLSGQLDVNLLLRNDGNLVFTDVADAAGVGAIGAHRHTSSGDYDNDGYPDIGVGHHAAVNRLYHNEQDGTFVNKAVEAGLTIEEHFFGFVFDDFDNDGWLDIMLPNYRSVGYPVGTMIFLNDQDGTFTEDSDGLGSQTAMGHNTGDVDGDGYPDVFIGTGRAGSPFDDVLYRVTPDGAGGVISEDISLSSGILASGPSRCHGSAFFDYDEDGDMDIYLNNGGPEWISSTLEEDFFWQNQGNDNRFYALSLEGVLSNRSAVGAKAVLTTSTGREVWRHLTAGKGFGNTDSPVLHFGLLPDETASTVRVVWPSRIQQVDRKIITDTRDHMLETGLRLIDQDLPGVSETVQVVGPAESLAEMIVSLDTVYIPLPAFNGVLEAFPFLVDPFSLPLGATGIGEIPVPIAEPEFSGLELYVQAYIHDAAGTEGMLTNLVDIVLE